MPPVDSNGTPVRVSVRGGEPTWVERSNTLMAWAARTSDRRAIHVSMLSRSETGLACDCQCPACGGTLQAVNAGKSADEYLRPGSMRPFFRHHTGQQRDDCLKRVAQLAALELLARKQEVELPAPTAYSQVFGASGDLYTGVATGKPLRARVVARSWVDEQSATLTLDDGRTVRVCLAGTQHVSSTEGVDALITIRIDDPQVSTWSPEEILEKVQLAGQWLCWTKHWDDAALAAEALRDAEARALEADDLFPEDLVLPEGLTQLQRSESVLHAILKRMIAEAGSILVPGLRSELSRRMPDGETRTKTIEIPGPIELMLDDVRLERRLGSIVPDVLCRATAPGKSLPPADLLIEVAVTHRVDSEKASKIRQMGLACVELDVALLGKRGRVKTGQLRQAVRGNASNKRWITHPHFEQLCDEARNDLERQARLYAELQQRIRRKGDWFRTAPPDQVVPACLDLLWASRHGREAVTADGVRMSPAEASNLLAARGLPGLRNDTFVTAVWRLDVIRGVSRGRAGSPREMVRQAYEERFDGRRWVALLLGGIEVYAPPMNAADRQWVEQLRRDVHQEVASGAFDCARPRTFDETIAAAFPELRDFLSDDRGTETEAHRVRLQQEQAALDAARRQRDAAAALVDEERRLREAEQEAQRARERFVAEQRAEAAVRRAEVERQEKQRRNRAWVWAPEGNPPSPLDALKAVRRELKVLPGNVRRVETLLRQAWTARAAGMTFPDFVSQVERDGPYNAGGAIMVLQASNLIARAR